MAGRDRRCLLAGLAGLPLCGSGLARAAGAELAVGQVVPLDEPGSVGNQLRLGIELCFEARNRRGGVHGARLRLHSRHRSQRSDDIVAKTRALLDEVSPVALVGFMGTGPMEALLRSGLLQARQVPVVGVRSGATVLRRGPGSEWLFHTRAGYDAEVARVLRHMTTIGTQRLGLYHEDSAFGAEVRTLVGQQAPGLGVQVVSLQPHPPRGADPRAAVAAFRQAGANAVLIGGTSDAAADFQQAWRAQGGGGLVAALSVAEGAQVLKRIGAEVAQGLAIVHVAPDPASTALALSRELQAVARERGRPSADLTQAVAEGYVAARTLVEGLLRAGPGLGPVRLRAALEGLALLDLGGVSIGFGPQARQGGAYVDIAILDRRGRMLR